MAVKVKNMFGLTDIIFILQHTLQQLFFRVFAGESAQSSFFNSMCGDYSYTHNVHMYAFFEKYSMNASLT